MSKQAAPARAPAAAAPGVSELTVIPSKDAEHGADLAAASSEDLETATSPAGILAAFSVQLDSASAMKAALQSAFSVAAAGLVERKQAPSAAEDELVQLRDMLKATTHTGQARSDDLTTPQALRTPWGGNAQRYKEASTLARDRTQRHLQPWDRTPHMDVPYLCRGLRPANHSLTEPWAKQAIEVWASASAGLGFSTSGLKKLDDGSRDSDVELFNRRMREDGDKAAATNRPKWDASPFIPMPTKFRGLNTFTHEPWTRDSQSFMLFEDARRAEEAHRLHGRESRASTAMLRHTYMGGALGGVKGGHGGPMHAIEM